MTHRTDPRIAQIHAYVTSDGEQSTGNIYSVEARQVAKQVARKKRLPAEADDIIQDALCKILEWIDRNPDAEIGNVGGMFRAVCTSVCNDRLRAKQREPLFVPMDEDRDIGTTDQEPVSPSDPTVPATDAYRALTEQLGAGPRQVSGVLTWLALESDGAIVLDDAPAPQAGVAVEQQLGWPALWFATRDRALFSSSRSASRRRQREIHKIAKLRLLVQFLMSKAVRP